MTGWKKCTCLGVSIICQTSFTSDSKRPSTNVGLSGNCSSSILVLVTERSTQLSRTFLGSKRPDSKRRFFRRWFGCHSWLGACSMRRRVPHAAWHVYLSSRIERRGDMNKDDVLFFISDIKHRVQLLQRMSALRGSSAVEVTNLCAPRHVGTKPALGGAVQQQAGVIRTRSSSERSCQC